jgi:hypothetical protein
MVVCFYAKVSVSAEPFPVPPQKVQTRMAKIFGHFFRKDSENILLTQEKNDFLF